MRIKLALLALAVPAAFATAIVFHPGVAMAITPMAKLQTTILGAGNYTVDPMHTSVGFDVNHMGLSRVQGRFTDVSGKVVVDPKRPERSSVIFRIGVQSIDTAVAPRDADLRSKSFFEVDKYPEIIFVSSKIQKRRHGYIATGNLTIHGTTQEVDIPFLAYGPTVTNMGTRVGIVSTPITISRRSYGIPYNTMMPDGKTPAVGDDVNIRLSMEATLDK